MTEDQLEQEALSWLADVGYETLNGPSIAPDGESPERADYLQVLLPFRLREAIHRLNPDIPTAAKEDALKQVLDLGIPALLSANRHFHKLLVGGVPVEYQKDGDTRGDFVRLIDWSNPAKNRWLAVNQFSIKGPHHTRRPDIILFVNGLPLVLLSRKTRPTRRPTSGKPTIRFRPTRNRSPMSSSTTNCWSFRMAARRAWVRSPAMASVSCNGGRLTA